MESKLIELEATFLEMFTEQEERTVALEDRVTELERRLSAAKVPDVLPVSEEGIQMDGLVTAGALKIEPDDPDVDYMLYISKKQNAYVVWKDGRRTLHTKVPRTVFDQLMNPSFSFSNYFRRHFLRMHPGRNMTKMRIPHVPAFQ